MPKTNQLKYDDYLFKMAIIEWRFNKNPILKKELTVSVLKMLLLTPLTTYDLWKKLNGFYLSRKETKGCVVTVKELVYLLIHYGMINKYFYDIFGEDYSRYIQKQENKTIEKSLITVKGLWFLYMNKKL